MYFDSHGLQVPLRDLRDYMAFSQCFFFFIIVTHFVFERKIILKLELFDIYGTYQPDTIVTMSGEVRFGIFTNLQ